MKILLAEDDRDMAKGISVFLGRNHYTVDIVDNGTDAYDYLSGGDYNMAVLDIMMPGMSGIEVLKKIRKEGNKIPILLLTAMGEVEDRIDGLDAGADDYLPKPFDAGELLARVKALLRRVENYTPDILEVGDLKLDRNRLRTLQRNCADHLYACFIRSSIPKNHEGNAGIPGLVPSGCLHSAARDCCS